jgi:putative acetyltransferase
VLIRQEQEPDFGTVAEVTRAAFDGQPYSHQTEVFIINALRAAQALSVSLVAELDGRVVGHIAFSPLTISDGTPDWYGMGPVSVLPELQRQGIGSLLVEAGLSQLRAARARGCALVGNPLFYQRFGFQNSPDLTLEGVPPEVFMTLSFDGSPARGEVTFHSAFFATE